MKEQYNKRTLKVFIQLEPWIWSLSRRDFRKLGSTSKGYNVFLSWQAPCLNKPHPVPFQTAQLIVYRVRNWVWTRKPVQSLPRILKGGSMTTVSCHGTLFLSWPGTHSSQWHHLAYHTLLLLSISLVTNINKSLFLSHIGEGNVLGELLAIAEFRFCSFCLILSRMTSQSTKLIILSEIKSIILSLWVRLLQDQPNLEGFWTHFALKPNALNSLKRKIMRFLLSEKSRDCLNSLSFTQNRNYLIQTCF